VFSVADPHNIDADSDPAFQFKADPDVTIHFDADFVTDPQRCELRLPKLMRIRIRNTGITLFYPHMNKLVPIVCIEPRMLDSFFILF
jgi:hypothetical protein